jgi:hypothetical protein
MASKTHIMSDETGQRIASALEAMARGSLLSYDEEAGEYKGVDRWLRSMRDGRIYTVKVPTGSAVACVKADANEGVAVPTVGTNSRASVDPYAALAPFFHIDCNATVDADGVPRITAISGDGNVWVLAPVLYWKVADTSDGAYTAVSISDTQLPGFSPQPGAMLPDGSLRPCMIYAKYLLSGSGSDPKSVSGAQPRTRDVSHDSLITICKTATTGYSGRSVADDWYPKVMFLMKYATKNSQSVFAGCASYDITKQPSAASSGATYIDVAKNHGFVAGSAIMVGTANTDRGYAAAHDKVDYAVIKSITPKDGSNDRLNLDRAVTVATADYIKTAPWPTGCCDGVQGDGSPTAPTVYKEPFVLQGIEMGMGCYEAMSGVALKYDGAACRVMVLHDTKKEATSISADYVDAGAGLPADATEGWKYPVRLSDADGMLVGTGSGASTTTGVCDGTYMKAASTVGSYEFLALGYLGGVAYAGLWYVNGNNALSDTRWNIGSRQSGWKPPHSRRVYPPARPPGGAGTPRQPTEMAGDHRAGRRRQLGRQPER